jgi:hypothetical protein
MVNADGETLPTRPVKLPGHVEASPAQVKERRPHKSSPLSHVADVAGLAASRRSCASTRSRPQESSFRHRRPEHSPSPHFRLRQCCAPRGRGLLPERGRLRGLCSAVRIPAISGASTPPATEATAMSSLPATVAPLASTPPATETPEQSRAPTTARNCDGHRERAEVARPGRVTAASDIDAHSLQPAVGTGAIGSVTASSAADIVLGCVYHWLKIWQAGPRRSQALLVSGPERENLSYQAFGFLPE